ncbi:hypothetical protein ACNKHU_04715 [Shigella flexneri]
MLLDAKKHPDQYRDSSACRGLFRVLHRALSRRQDDIIARTNSML